MAPAQPGQWEPCLPPLERAYIDVALEGWHKDPNKVAVIDLTTGKELTFRELEDNVRSFAGSLQALGVRTGKRVQFFAGNSLKTLVAEQALLFSNASLFFFKPYNTTKYAEYKYETLDADVEIIITDAVNYDLAVHQFLADPDCHVEKVIIVEGTPRNSVAEQKVLFFDQLPQQEFVPPTDVRIHEDVFVVPYTSGSTGLPKGVMHTQYSFVNALTAISRAIPREDRHTDRTLVLSTFAYISGLLGSSGNMIFGGTLLLGTEAVLLDFPEYVERYKPTQVTVFECWMQVLLKNETRFPNRVQMMSSLRHVIIGGTVFPEHRRKQTREYFENIPFINCYGATESLGAMAFGLPSFELGADVGFLVPYFEVKIVNDEGNPVEVGEPGELLWRGPQQTLGYWKRDNSREFTGDGYFPSGDIVTVDSDGIITIVGRKKQFIICIDERVAPDEIESVLLQHPAVREAVVVPTPHPVVQEAPTGLVVLSSDYENHDLNQLRDELVDFVKDRLSEYKQLHGGVYFLTELDRTMSGKYARKVLTDRALQLVDHKN